jgi:hypothetical protein
MTRQSRATCWAVVAASRVRGLNMKGLDDRFVLALEDDAIMLAAELEAVRRSGDEATVAEIESFLKKALALLDEAAIC